MVNVVAFRGQYGNSDGLVHSHQRALYFGEYDVARHYALNPNQRGAIVEKPHIITAKLTIRNPFINLPGDAFIDLDMVLDKLGKEEVFRIANKFAHLFYQTSVWPELGRFGTVVNALKHDFSLVNQLYFQAYPFLEDNHEVDRLIVAGFDGAIHRGSGVSGSTDEYCVFSKEQVDILDLAWL